MILNIDNAYYQLYIYTVVNLMINMNSTLFIIY